MSDFVVQNLSKGRAALERGDTASCESICRAVLQDHQDHPKALLLLGRCLGQSGRVQEALAPLEGAANRMPKNPDAHYSLGMALAAVGKKSEAEAAYRTCLTLAPQHAYAYANLGVLLLGSGSLHLAIACFREATIINPALEMAGENLAAALYEVERFEDAHTVLSDLIDGQNAPPLRFVLFRARILEKLARHDEAVGILNRVVKDNPTNAEALYALGQAQLAASQVKAAAETFRHGARGTDQTAYFESAAANALMLAGDLEAAETAGKRAVSLDPRMGNAWLTIASVRSFKDDDPDLAAMIAARQASNLSPPAAMDLDFALGRALESAGDRDRAFGYFMAGNQTKRKQVGSELDAVIATHEAIIEYYQHNPIEALRGPSLPKLEPTPLFIIGLPRSGTTLLEQILASHPEVSAAGELKAMNDATLESIPNYPEGLVQLSNERLARLAMAYDHRRPNCSDDVRYLTDKMPVNFEKVGLIIQSLPSAPVVHIRRSPLDNCLSCFITNFKEGQRFSYDLEELGHYYRRYHDLMELWRKVLPNGRMLEINYEDLVQNPEPEIRRLLDYCGLAWSGDCLAFHKNKRSVETASAAQVRKPIYSSSIGRWRRFEGHLAPLIKALGPLADISS
ncbi:MAG: sulfotransferase [Pseudomonadota bacterium]